MSHISFDNIDIKHVKAHVQYEDMAKRLNQTGLALCKWYFLCTFNQPVCELNPFALEIDIGWIIEMTLSCNGRNCWHTKALHICIYD